MAPVHPWAVSVIPATRETAVVNTVSTSIPDRERKTPVILNKYKKINMRFHDADDLDLYFQITCTPQSMSTWCLLLR